MMVRIRKQGSLPKRALTLLVIVHCYTFGCDGNSDRTKEVRSQAADVCLQGVRCDPSSQADLDGDGIVDKADNCPRHANVEQTDGDRDGLGDSCDPLPGTRTFTMNGQTLGTPADRGSNGGTLNSSNSRFQMQSRLMK